MTEWIAEEDCTVAIVGATTESTEGQRTFQVGQGESFKVALGRSGFTYYIGSSPGHLPERKLDFSRATPIRLRVVRGPQCDLFTSAWTEAPFHVSNQRSRAGFRLTASFDAHAIELPSEPACPGAIQVTPDGNAIILGPDGPTIGGYPKVAVVCSCDLDQLAHLRPGSQIHFEEVFIEQAKELHRDYRATLAKRVAQIRLGARG
jgi:allophanate hydrolase subunit 2